ncbi:hypothetical protein CVD25_00925 [Bacillus canaveralius]|uniref:Uncharacterized protein n=1 Tax=Bacillus canaveralius TaxID=1403243 RepID=A0A2N5GPJ0_9BACI|nr:hypothetical protein [Bacillus canaveralius]PLR84630.1 hypothetical protein CU635_06030 [Bacillus canaveralius]PLS00782.1 hypothetical protein CVD25_00925 [Bacillus canaveralius]
MAYNWEERLQELESQKSFIEKWAKTKGFHNLPNEIQALVWRGVVYTEESIENIHNHLKAK